MISVRMGSSINGRIATLANKGGAHSTNFTSYKACKSQRLHMPSVTRCWSKKQPKFFQKLPKKQAQQFLHKSWVFQIAQKVANNLGYCCQKFCHQKLLKIAQSGHTDDGCDCATGEGLTKIVLLRAFLDHSGNATLDQNSLWRPPQVCVSVCANHPAAPGSNHKHNIDAVFNL